MKFTLFRFGAHVIVRSTLGMLLSAFLLTACGNGIDTAEWTEEVKLSDGSVITVWRKERARSNGFPNARRGGYVDLEFRYEPLGVHWKDVATPVHVRKPVAFDFIDGVPHLVLSGSRDICVNRAKTEYMAEILKWVDGRWVEVPQAQFPADHIYMNLLRVPWGHTVDGDARGKLSLAEKELKYHHRSDKQETVSKWFQNRICKYVGPPARYDRLR